MKYLISAGADFQTKNSKDKTPLDVADTKKIRRILREAMDAKQ
jgi:hypothetical protein